MFFGLVNCQKSEIVLCVNVTCLGASASVTLQFVSISTSTLDTSSPWQVFTVLPTATIFVAALRHNCDDSNIRSLGVFPVVAVRLCHCVVVVILYLCHMSCRGTEENRGTESVLAPGCTSPHWDMGSYDRDSDLWHTEAKLKGIVSTHNQNKYKFSYNILISVSLSAHRAGVSTLCSMGAITDNVKSHRDWVEER